MNTEQTNAPPAGAAQGAGPEQLPPPNADLAALVNEARQVDGQPAAAAAQASTAVAISMTAQNRGELHAALVMARDAALPLIAMVSERKAAMLSAVWGDQQLEAISKSGAEVLALHGIALSNITGGFGPYIALAMSLGPCVYATHRVMVSKDPEPVEEVSGGQQQ